MNNKRPLPPIVVFAILTTITTIAWVGFEVYRAYTNDPISSVPEAVLNPLDPSLEIETLSSISQRVYLEEEEIGSTELISFEIEPVEGTGEEETGEEIPEEALVEEDEEEIIEETPEEGLNDEEEI